MRGVWLLKPVNPLSSKSTAKPSVTSSWLSAPRVASEAQSPGGRSSEPWPCPHHAEASLRAFTSGSPSSVLIYKMGLASRPSQSCRDW